MCLAVDNRVDFIVCIEHGLPNRLILCESAWIHVRIFMHGHVWRRFISMRRTRQWCAHTNTRPFCLAKQVGKYGETRIDWICFSGWAIWMGAGARIPRGTDFIFCLLVAIDLTHDSQCSILRSANNRCCRQIVPVDKKIWLSLIEACFFLELKQSQIQHTSCPLCGIAEIEAIEWMAQHFWMVCSWAVRVNSPSKSSSCTSDGANI